jgi:hypothetical protein
MLEDRWLEGEEALHFEVVFNFVSAINEPD